MDRKEPAWIIEHYNVYSEPGKSHLTRFVDRTSVAKYLIDTQVKVDSTLAVNEQQTCSRLHEGRRAAHNPASYKDRQHMPGRSTSREPEGRAKNQDAAGVVQTAASPEVRNPLWLGRES